jgi:hypothetical protein
MSDYHIARCVVLRECMKPLGDEMDRLDAVRANGGLSEEQAGQYRRIDAVYDRLFDQWCDADPAIPTRILAGEII